MATLTANTDPIDKKPLFQSTSVVLADANRIVPHMIHPASAPSLDHKTSKKSDNGVENTADKTVFAKSPLVTSSLQASPGPQTRTTPTVASTTAAAGSKVMSSMNAASAAIRQAQESIRRLQEKRNALLTPNPIQSIANDSQPTSPLNESPLFFPPGTSGPASAVVSEPTSPRESPVRRPSSRRDSLVSPGAAAALARSLATLPAERNVSHHATRDAPAHAISTIGDAPQARKGSFTHSHLSDPPRTSADLMSARSPAPSSQQGSPPPTYLAPTRNTQRRHSLSHHP